MKFMYSKDNNVLTRLGLVSHIIVSQFEALPTQKITTSVIMNDVEEAVMVFAFWVGRN